MGLVAHHFNLLASFRFLLSATLTTWVIVSPARASAQDEGSSEPAKPPSTTFTPSEPSAPTEPPGTPAYQPRQRKAWAINLAYGLNTLTGDDFDGSHALGRPGEGIIIPKLGVGHGFMIGVGHGASAEEIGSFGYWSGLTYAATWFKPSSPYAPAATDSAILHDLEVQLRVAYRAARWLAPYLQLSVAYGFLPIKGFHAIGTSGDNLIFDNESMLFSNTSFGIGLGSLFPISEAISIDAFAGYRAFIVTNVDGQDLDDNLNAGGFQFHLGPAFFF